MLMKSHADTCSREQPRMVHNFEKAKPSADD
ncbi:hypothetical protein VPHD481_0217 [Vibrio phage D481]